MTRMTVGVNALVQRGSVRAPADTLEIALCQRCLPAPAPLALYLHTDGAAVGRVDVLPLRRLIQAQGAGSALTRPTGAVVFATGPEDAVFFLDTLDALGQGVSTVWGQSPSEPEPQLVAHNLDDFLIAVVSEEIDPWPLAASPAPPPPPPTALPDRHGALYADRLGRALRYVPNAKSATRYALRRAVSLSASERQRMLAAFADAIATQLPGAFAREIVTDAMMDRVIAHMVEPLLAKVRKTRKSRSGASPANHVTQLREALLVGSLGDLGEFFCEEIELHLYGFVSEYLALLELHDLPEAPAPAELALRLKGLDKHLRFIDTTADELLEALPRTPNRDGAARDILEPLGYAWLIDLAAD